MLTVYLADDEPVILRGLRKLLDWDKLGLEIIGECRNGDDLIRAIEADKPDLVITDIAMPRMTGIEVLKRIREGGWPTRVVFISAYREFSYAQDALSFGAAGYLIKPINRAKLEEIVRKTVDNIRSEARQQINEVKLRDLETKQRRHAEWEDLKSLLESPGGTPDEAILDALQGDDSRAVFSVLAIAPDPIAAAAERWGEGRRRLLLFAIRNIAEEMFGGQGACWTFPSEDRLIFLLRHAPDLNVFRLAEAVHAGINEYLKQGVTIGVSPAGSPAQLPTHHKRCREALELSYFLGWNRVLASGSLPPALAGSGLDREKTEKELQRELFAPDGDPEPYLELLLEEIRRQAWGRKAYAVSLCNTLTIKLLRGLLPREDDWRDEAEQELFIRLSACPTLDELFAWMRGRIRSAREELAAGSQESRQIVEIKRYIGDNYRSEINLETMASRFYMNPYYFSSFFKKHVGQNFKQYLTEVRMREATHLLLHSDSMLYEIAERTGFSNARQFSEIFRKYYGALPNDYRQAKRT
ncbi:response regulator transcription factor [Cohnella fermenti]|uniref:Response regulator n=1 Tax=Cohnella fermenti TaxID=2565925 RepID=A0A4S4BS48_9BACL|nr:response regulator [Cohnella fermenti]THF77812.1 response regulator [Cohnella fermenti]